MRQLVSGSATWQKWLVVGKKYDGGFFETCPLHVLDRTITWCKSTLWKLLVNAERPYAKDFLQQLILLQKRRFENEGGK